MNNKFDVVVIGSGVAGATVAHNCRAAGWSVAIVDSLPFGGTCALRGCDPKKVLFEVASLLDRSRRMKGYGIASEDIHLDWPALVRFKREVTVPFSENAEKGFKGAGIAAFHGAARFVDRTAVKVGDDVLQGRFVVIAVGAKPAKLNIPGEKYLTTSAAFMEVDKLPQRILFVGGGFISFEFSFVAALAGARPHILHQGARPLEGFDPEVVERLTEGAHEAGIEISLDSHVEALEKTPDHLLVYASSAAGRQSFEADMVVHGAGRVPAIDDLELEKAGVLRDGRSVTINRYLQSTSNPAVYVVGDAAAKAQQLTPVSIMEGEVVAKNLTEGNVQEPDYTGIPMVAFTIPPLAAVGLQEKDASEQGLKYTVHSGDSSGWYTARHLRMKHTGYKVLVEEGTKRVLGAHLLGPGVEEAINLFAVAIRQGVTAKDLKRMVYSYPTQTFDINWEI